MSTKKKNSNFINSFFNFVNYQGSLWLFKNKLKRLGLKSILQAETYANTDARVIKEGVNLANLTARPTPLYDQLRLKYIWNRKGKKSHLSANFQCIGCHYYAESNPILSKQDNEQFLTEVSHHGCTNFHGTGENSSFTTGIADPADYEWYEFVEADDERKTKVPVAKADFKPPEAMRFPSAVIPVEIM